MDSRLKHNPKDDRPSRVMIVTGEASGDLHGGALAEALRSKNPALSIVGFGGKMMRSAGVDVRFDINQLGIVGLIEVLYHFSAVIRAYRTAVKLLREKVDLLVLIDFPDFNLRLAKTAKRMGIPVVYYVSPQIWAWRAGRIKTIAERVDQMLVILPFEKKIYDAANVPCEFVGHPLLDELAQIEIKNTVSGRVFLDKTSSRDLKGPTIALLPGSRKREVISLLPVMLTGIESLAGRYPDLRVLIPVAPSLPEGLVPELTASSPLPIKIIKGSVYDVFQVSDLAVVASGTATLQGALAGTPMVVVYKVSPVSYWLAKFLIHVKSISLANIVADHPFIPELIQGEASSSRISKEVERLLKDEPARELMKQGLQRVAHRLGTAGASIRAASIICQMLDRRQKKNETGTLKQQVSG